MQERSRRGRGLLAGVLLEGNCSPPKRETRRARLGGLCSIFSSPGPRARTSRGEPGPGVIDLRLGLGEPTSCRPLVSHWFPLAIPGLAPSAGRDKIGSKFRVTSFCHCFFDCSQRCKLQGGAKSFGLPHFFFCPSFFFMGALLFSDPPFCGLCKPPECTPNDACSLAATLCSTTNSVSLDSGCGWMSPYTVATWLDGRFRSIRSPSRAVSAWNLYASSRHRTPNKR